MTRTISVVTGSRADFGIYRPVLKAIQNHPALQLRLLVCGMHLAPEFGSTVEAILAEGIPVAERIDTLLACDSPEAVAKSMGLGLIGFAQSFAQNRPDLLLVLGDRYEMFAAATASMPFAIPLAHLHGGEATEGLIDEPIRHGLTKMSHLHFVTTEEYRRRVIQLGEQPDRVFLTGAPSLDNLHAIQFVEPDALEHHVGMSLQPAPLLATYHPVTLEYEDTEQHMAEFLGALHDIGRPVLFTYPNADTQGRQIIEAINRYLADHPDSRATRSLGTTRYFSLMRHAAAMVGNSSSGLVEAASFALPVVNIGNRQRGRVRGANVIDVADGRQAIADAIRRAIDPEFKASLAGMKNPYGDGTAAERIVDILSTAPLGRELIEKRFFDLPTV